MITILIALSFVGIALVLYLLFPDVVERWFRRYTTIQQAGWAAFSLLLAFVFIGSGSTILVAVGGLILVLVTLTLVIDDPLGLID